MTDNEPSLASTGTITPNYLNSLAYELTNPYPQALFPQKEDIAREVMPDEVERAKQSSQYVNIPNDKLPDEVDKFIESYLKEMTQYEQVARQSPQERLRKLKEIAPRIKKVVVRSAPGDYKHAFKKDKYKDIPAMQAADRLRADQAAMLAVVLAGIREGWDDEILLSFLNTRVLRDFNPQIDRYREMARNAVVKRGIRIVYTGNENEVYAMQKLLSHENNTWIPKDSVDVLDHSHINDTLDQTKQLTEHLSRLKTGDGFIELTNVQGARSARMDQMHGLIPDGCMGYQFVMPTSGEGELAYRTGEVKGALYYWLSGNASEKPAPYVLI